MFRVLFLALAFWSATAAVSQADPFAIYMIVHRAGSGADDGFRDYLKANGVDAEFIFRDMENDRSRLPGYVEEIKALKPDLVYTQTTSVTRAVVGRLEEADPEKHVLDIPVVFSMVSFPARSKLVPQPPDPAAPMLSKRNLTGARHVVSNVVRLNAMRTYMPFEKLGMLYDRSSGAQRRSEASMRALAEEAGIEFVSDSPTEPEVERDPEQIEPALRRLKEAGVDFLYIPPSNFFGAHAERVTGAATELGLPTFCGVETLIRYHCMTGLVSPLYAVGQFAAFKAEQILASGKDPGEIPIETLSRFSFVVNMETAHKLKVYPPMEILRFAQFIKTGADS
ncbi:MAG: ABC transporter substrate-binding protein [Alphaproteobacteria bacterium]|nr:ABC transporter substrate-binding protein [Alphaproteobacteria bacterium]